MVYGINFTDLFIARVKLHELVKFHVINSYLFGGLPCFAKYFAKSSILHMNITDCFETR